MCVFVLKILGWVVQAVNLYIASSIIRATTTYKIALITIKLIEFNSINGNLTVYKVILLIISNITNIHHVQTNIIVLLVLMDDIIAVQCLTHKFKVILFVLLITVVELIEIIFSTYDCHIFNRICFN